MRVWRRWIPTLAALSAASAFGAEPDSVDPNLWLSASNPSSRLLVYRICSPEHCWTESYLEWLESTGTSPTVVARSEIAELGYGRFVTALRSDSAAGSRAFIATVSPSHGGFDPLVFTITPGKPNRYEASAVSTNGLSRAAWDKALHSRHRSLDTCTVPDALRSNLLPTRPEGTIETVVPESALSPSAECLVSVVARPTADFVYILVRPPQSDQITAVLGPFERDASDF